MTGTEELDRIKKEKQERKGKVNMCKAIDDMLADAREEGRKETMNGLQEMIADAREEGESKGRNEERERIIQILVNDYFTSGISKENFCEKLQNMFSMDQKTAENYMKRFSG